MGRFRLGGHGEPILPAPVPLARIGLQYPRAVASPRSSPRTADQIGLVLGGRYRLTGLVGTGASAHVYVAEDVTLRRTVAVKTLHPALADDEAFLRRFRAEAQAAAALNHPNILRVFDWGEDAQGPYLVSEFLAGGSLRDLLDAGARLSPSQALVVGLDAARALDYAHRRGLVHRDIKPANLLFDDEGRLCVADFGLARALAESSWTEPEGVVLGTARYASPEQVTGATLDGRADIYALALVLIESVTGQVPFAADTTIATLMARVNQALEVPAELGPLGGVLARAATADPAERLDASGLAQALDHAATELPRPQPIPVGWASTTALAHTGPGSTHETELGLRPRLYDGAADWGGPAAGVAAGAALAGAPGVLASEPGHTGGRADAPAGAAVPAADTAMVVPVPRPRRWRRRVVVGLAIALLALGVTAGVFAAIRVAEPSYAVPNVVGLTEAKAAAALLPEHLHLRVTGQRFDEAAAAGVVLDQVPPVARKLRRGSSVAVHVSAGPQPRAVPDLSGLSAAAAAAKLKAAGLGFAENDTVSDDVAKGFVIGWNPKDGLQPRGTVVTVTVSQGSQPLPDVTQMTPDQAQAALTAAGYKSTISPQFSDTVPSGQILSTNPAPGTPTAKGSTVTINVSKGPDMTTVPTGIIGGSVDQAVALLQQAGLQLGQVFGPSRKGQVFYSDPTPGTKVKRQSTVNLYTF